MIRIFQPIPVDSLELYVFDLDGTLIDSTRDLANSVNATLTELKLGSLPDATIAGFVGNGVPLLLRRSLGRIAGIEPEAVDESLFDRAQRFFLPYYEQHMLDFTKLYECARESLEALIAADQAPGAKKKTLAVCTNKPERHSIGICKALGIDRYFLRIYGGDTFKTRKPDPEGLQALVSEAGVSATATVMVGDSKGDVQVARNAGAWSLGCAFGFGPQTLLENRPDIWVDTARDWTSVLLPKS
jgi:phosphoglycolate phosphatase